MNQLKKFVQSLAFKPATLPWFLLAICILAYGVLIPWLGFYSDDWIFVWTAQKLGTAGLTRYFSTNRPFWGLLYQITTSLVGAAPWKWQVFALVARWLTGVTSWWLIRSTWPQKEKLAAWTAILVTVYPGLVVQPVALTGSHIYIILSIFLASLTLTVKALRETSRRWKFTFLALFTCLVNLLTMEFFFMLEPLRFLLIWFVGKGEKKSFWAEFLRSLRTWSPYLALFLGAGIWRAFFFPYQDLNHPTVLISQLMTEPLQALLSLPGAFWHNIWISSIAAWARPFAFQMLAGSGRKALLGYAILVPVGFVLAFVFISRYSASKEVLEKNQKNLKPLLLALACLALAGIPFLVTALVPDLWSFSSRFNIPFMFGACLLFTFILLSIPLPRWLNTVVFSILIGFCIGQQFIAANLYRLDWELQNRFYWQLAWRAPRLEPGTLIVANDFPSSLGGASAYTSALNWIYAPENDSKNMSYAFVYGTERPGLLTHELTGIDYLSGIFRVDPEKILMVNYTNRCLQVLDPEFNFEFPYLHNRIEGMTALSNPAVILSATDDRSLINGVPFQPEPKHDWCYFYSKADLARQFGNWQEVIELGEEAFSKFGYAIDFDYELFPFIQAYAITGEWSKALDLLKVGIQFETNLNHPLQRQRYSELWNFIDENTPANPDKEAAYQEWLRLVSQ
jgi:hypothetical protein